MKKQFELLDEIYNEFYLSPDNFESLEYIYKFNPDENWVGTELTTVINGITKPIYMTESSEDRIKELCNKLHDEMQSHTGGDWRKFIFTINKEGKVNTKFIYDKQSCMDDEW